MSKQKIDKEEKTKPELYTVLPVVKNGLINYDNLAESILVKAVREFYDFPDNLHDFNVVNDNEHYVEIEFKNYRQAHCSIVYQKTLNDIRLKKGIGGVNFNYLKLINNLIDLGVFSVNYR